MPDSNKIALVSYKSAVNIDKYRQPAIGNRNRLEGSPRLEQFDRSLRAEVRDPLWMLCRQWQFGEFRGEDAGTAFQAKILAGHSSPKQLILSDGQSLPYTADQPLEMIVEREIVEPTLHLRVEIARYAMLVIRQQVMDNNIPLLLRLYPIDVVPHPDDHEALFLAISVNGRLPDGYKMLQAMQNGQFIAQLSALPEFDVAAYKTKMEKLQTELLRWYAGFYQQPAPGLSAWVPNHLEYNFSLELPAENGHKTLLNADQYASGHLDWYAFDEQRGAPAPDEAVEEKVQSFIPTPLQFRGMPHPRFWQMEENRTDFGKIDASPTGLLSVLLAEYGLTYSNDWFILPYQLNINTVCEVKGIMVKDVFGMNILVEAALKDPEVDWQEFAVFHQTERQNDTQNRNRYFLPPAVGKLLESDPLEKVNFMRDEMANMVWAIEQVVPSEAGGGRELRRKLFRLAADFTPAPVEDPAGQVPKIRYVLGSTVPDNWIPFIPVHKKKEIIAVLSDNTGGITVPIPPPEDDKNFEIRLQRARLPGALPPKSTLLKEQQPVCFIEEEEVPRAGAIVERRFQRTRWLHGRSYLWLGRRKMAGRGEGWSGLMFDQIIPIERKETTP